MKVKSLYVVPIIGIGYFDQTIITKESKWFIRTIVLLCFKLELYKRLDC
jgi:hypothetical protein